MTSGTYGPHGFGSSASAALASSLANKLHRATDLLGSTLWRLTWKARSLPSGRLIYALRASERRTSDSGYTSWRSPQSSDGEGGVMEIRDGVAGKYKLRDESQLASWPTAQSRDWKGPQGRAYKGESEGLPSIARLTGWQSPTTTAIGRTDQEAIEKRKDFRTSIGRNSLAPGNLEEQAILYASWATPSGRDFKSNEGSEEFHAARMEQTRGKPLSEQAHQLATVSGETPNGFTAETTSGGQLNPAHSRWLQGLPEAWDTAAILASRQMKRE